MLSLSFHNKFKHAIGRYLPTALPFAASFWIRAVLICPSQLGFERNFTLLFNSLVNLCCWLVNFLCQNSRLPSNHGALQFAIFLSCFVIFFLVISVLSWILTFYSPKSTSLNYSTSFLYGTELSQNLLQNYFASSALSGTCPDLCFPPNSL